MPRGAQVRTRLDSFPAAIGRAYNNDIILDDPYVCPRHLRIERDAQGQLVIEDVGSVNSTTVASVGTANGGGGGGGGGNGDRLSRVVLRSGLELRVGRTTLRFWDPEHPVAATLVNADGAVQTRGAGSAVGALLVCAVAFGALTIDAWLGSYDRTSLAKHAADSVGWISALATWAGVWALATRVVRHRFHFLAHLVVASAVTVGFIALSAVSEWAAFLDPDAGLDGLLWVVLGIPLAAALFAGHLAFASALSRRARWRVAASIIGGAAGVFALGAYADRAEFSTSLEYSSAIKPAKGWARTVSLDEFIRATGELEAQVDSLATREPPGGKP
ncbi:MAG: FHA domain-containing protein [Gemmatimonadota bacterium]|nr:FHA domain-containing protein [Gemmatimonadota bacterium]